VREAGDGKAGVEAWIEWRPHLVCMDIRMPVMDGYAATRRIREREERLGLPRVPILALTADAFAEDAQRATAAGMDGHLTKPYTHAQLRELLEAWV
jgi:CheY-like chemotaxis protein